MGERACRGIIGGIHRHPGAGLLVGLLGVEDTSVQLHPGFSMPHLLFRGVKVSVCLHTAAEVPLVDITAVEVLLGDFMEAEVDFMEVDLVEEEVREVTAKPHSLLPFNYANHYSGLFWVWEVWPNPSEFSGRDWRGRPERLAGQPHKKVGDRKDLPLRFFPPLPEIRF